MAASLFAGGCRSLVPRACRPASPLMVRSSKRHMGCCHWYEPTPGGDNIWQVDLSTLKYGRGALKEVGMDARELELRRVAVFTDARQRDMPHLHTVLDALREAGIEATVYDEVAVEPTDQSFIDAARFVSQGSFDGFVSVGGGSVIDTCKAANLYATCPPTRGFLEYVNAPIGLGAPVPRRLLPHIACPTTSGTGSETTGLAIFDLLEMKAKTGIQSRRIRPTLAVVDPLTTHTMPAEVAAASGFDVLSHAVESLTARPYARREHPLQPHLRPMSQGSNPWSDIGAQEALRLTGMYLERAVNDASDHEAREGMMLASTLAGIAFGNAGCHMPHGLSYSVSGGVKDFRPKNGYPTNQPLVPHGMSVILSAPSVFRWTASACPDRHVTAARCLGADVRSARPEDGGEVLALRIVELMKATGVPNGLSAIGYCAHDVPLLTKGAMPQRRLLDNAPRPPSEADVSSIYASSMRYW